MTPRKRAAPRVPKDREEKTPPADWTGKTLIVLRGGRRDGAWFFAEDFALGPALHDPRAIAYGYEPTDDTEPHPDYPVSGRVWRHVGP